MKPLLVQVFFAGAARRAGPNSMLILCVCVCVCVRLCKIISRPLIGQKSATSPGIVQRSYTRRTLRLMSSTKATYLQQKEYKTNNKSLSLAVPHSELHYSKNRFLKEKFTCVHTTGCKTQSEIEQEYWHKRRHCRGSHTNLNTSKYIEEIIQVTYL